MIGWIIAVAVVMFVLGMAMSVLPNAHDKAIERLREQALKQGYNVRVLACPDWMIGPQGVKGKGMVSYYELSQPSLTLGLTRALGIDGRLSVVDGAPQLHDQPINMSEFKGFVCYGFFAKDERYGVYIEEPVHAQEPIKAQVKNEEFLTQLTKNLQTWRDLIG